MTSHLAPTHIVGIDAPAGGLAALEAFFKAMPDDSGMAFVLAQHLSPDVKGLMDDLLARNTQMPIRRVENGMELTANAIYLIPPHQGMTVTEGHLYLQDRVDQHPILPTDSFFESLASAAQNRAIGIILSDAGSDGVRGIQAIHEVGGLVLVQSGESAQFDGLPPATIHAGPAHYVTSPVEMPALLLEYARNPDGVRAAADEPDKNFSREPIDRQTLLDYEQVISRLVHAGVLLDAQFQVLRYFGAIGQYLKAPAGEPMVDIAQIVADDLHPALSEALQQAATRKERFSLPGVAVKQGETVQWVDLSVDCIPREKTGGQCYLVTLTPAEPPELLSDLEVGVLFLDANLTVRKFNPASAVAFELMPQDVGRPIEGIACRLTDQAAMLSSLRHVLESGQAVETEVQARNGIWLIQRALPYLNDKQEVTGVILTFTDVTRVKNDQLRLRTLFDRLPVGAAIFDRDGNVIEANQRLSAIIALSQGGQERQQTLRTDGTEMPADELAAAQVLRTRQPVYDVQTGFSHEDGSLVWANVSAAPLPDGSVVVVTADTTGSKQSADTERSRLLERLDLAAHAAGIGIWDWDIQKNEIVWDDQMYALYGLQPGGSGRAYDAWLQGVHPDDRTSSDEISARAVRGEAKYDTEFRVLWPDGSVHWLKADGEVFRDQDGRPTRMVGVNFDITDRKALEESLRDSEQKHTLLFEKSAVPTVLLKLPEVVIADVNEACEKLTGFTRAEMIGKTSVELGLTRKEVREETIASFTQTGMLIENEISLFTKSGELRIVIANTTPVRMSEGMYAITTIQDISSRKQAEGRLRVALAKYQTLFDTFPLGITVADEEGKIVETNRVAEKLLGISEEEQKQRAIDGAEWRIIRPDGTPMPVEEYASVRALKEATKVENVEMGVVKPDGEVTWINVSAAPLPIEGDGVVVTYSDISERKQAESALKRSEKLLSETGRIAKIGGWELDIATMKQVWTDATYDIHDRERGVYDPNSTEELSRFEPGSKERIETAFAEAIRQGTPYDLEVEMTTVKGNRKWVRAVCSPILANGKVTRLTGTVQDITDRRQAEENLRASEAKFRAVFDNAPVGISLLDSERNLLESNDMLAQMVCMDKARLASGGYRKRRYIRQDGSEFLASELASSRAIAERRAVRDVVNGIVLEDGEIIWTQVSAAPLGAGDPRFVVITQDITERKTMEQMLQESERNYRELVQNANSAIIRWRGDGTIAFFNEYAQTLFGYRSAEILGKPIGILVPATDSSGGDLSTLVQNIVDHPEDFVNVVNENICRDGRRVWMAWTNKPVYDEHGQVSEILAVGGDITSRKRIEDELRRSNAELEQFAYIASHDLQEPLRTVAGMVQLLQQRYQSQLDERADEYIHFAVDASNRMQQLINGLLDFSRVDRKERSFAATDMEQVLQRALANLQSAIAESGAQITADPLPTVQADGEQLTQVLQNLIGNAIKFRGEQPLEIHIGAEKTEDGWQFAVRDNGIGIEPHYFERVFLIFQRLHTRRKYPGTGIGLAICRKIIERHGGKIWVQSQLNHGATFFFTLPERSTA